MEKRIRLGKWLATARGKRSAGLAGHPSLAGILTESLAGKCNRLTCLRSILARELCCGGSGRDGRRHDVVVRFWLLFFLVHESLKIGKRPQGLFSFLHCFGEGLDLFGLGRRPVDSLGVLLILPAAALVAPAAAIGPRRTVVSGRRTGADGLRPALLLPSALGLRLSRWAWRALLLWWALLLGGPLLFPRRARRSLAPGRDGGERYAAAILIDIDHPHLEHIADTDDLMRIANKAVCQAADMHQAAVGQTNIDEHAEINNVEDRPGQLHALRQILQLDDSAAKDGGRKVIARVERGAGERSENILEQMRPHAQLRSELVDIDAGGALGDETAGG